MPQIKVGKIKSLNGEFVAPADKSVSQRAVIISAIAAGKTRIHNFLDCDDCQNAIRAFGKMGIETKLKDTKDGKLLEVWGRGLYGLIRPKSNIYLGNSGTTMRIICGLMAAQKFKTVLTGDKLLSARPMRRVIEPLKAMGADITGCIKDKQLYPPLTISGRNLKGVSYKMPVKSAQVKSSILMAGLYAQGKTKISEILKTRDHTERMLRLFGADIKVNGLEVAISGKKILISPGNIYIPGDISSCAFFIVGATIIPGSKIIIRGVGLNPTRSYFFTILKRMGADVCILKKKNLHNNSEPCADIKVCSSHLSATVLTEEEVAYCIDELPILAVAACFAKGITRISHAAELRIKETDRIYSMVTNLKKMGASIHNEGNDLIIKGTGRLKGATLSSFGDHRTAMSMAIAGLAAIGDTTIKNTQCINKSYPDFSKILKNITLAGAKLLV